MASFTSLVVLTLLLALCFSATIAQPAPPLVGGLSWSFYKSNCPSLEKTVRAELKKAFKKDIGLAAGLLRIHFHDCFVQGCDGSVLLAGSAGGPGEQTAPPNLSLRPAALELINNIRALVHKACGQVVSCSDITALAARDAVFLSGGPDYRVPLGRRDGLNFATIDATNANLPPFFFSARQLIDFVANKGLDATDLVAISGGHTIGISHCTSFTERLYPDQDPTMDQTFAKNLKRTCPAVDTDATTNLDIRSPNVFDNKYYVDLMNRQGLFTSDQDLYTDKTTRPIVLSFAVNQTLFFERFAFSMVKMSQMSVLTGRQGEIRSNCSRQNSASTDYLATLVDGEGDSAAF
ncbi:peroxidase [Ranunculus cassubicifolius]